MSKKYDALGRYLKAHSGQNEVCLTFAEIEEIIGSKLPPSAYAHRPWWSNNPSNNVMTKVWKEAGFQAEQVDMEGCTLVFRNIGKMMRELESDPVALEAANGFVRAFAEERRGFMGQDEQEPVPRHPLIGSMKGTFTIEPGWDLTKPAMDDGEIAEWEANLQRTADMIEQGLKGKKP